MAQNSNVVQLETKRTMDNSASVKLPAPILKLRERCGAHLKKLLDRLFEQIDDTFFDLADQASSNLEQSSYFDAMREVRLKKTAMTSAFIENYQKDFRFETQDPIADAILSLDSDNLSLVKHDELEEQVAIDNIVKRVQNEVGQELEHLTLRMDVLLPTVKITEQNNPIGSYRLANGFAKACQLLEFEIGSKIVLYKLFEKQVLSQAKAMLMAANKYLIDQGVMPDLATVKKTQKAEAIPPRQHSYSGPQSQNANPQSGNIIDGQTGDLVSEDGGLQGDVAFAGGVDPMALISQLHHQMPNINQGYTESNLPVLRQTSLVSALSGAQQRFETIPVNEAGLINFVNLIKRMLRGSDGNPRAKVNQTDQDAINLVSMLFEFILEDRQLQAPIKAVLGRLQIPMVKVALVDSTFFNRGGHVARRLLNEMAMASIGWTEKEGGNDPFYNKLEEIVLKIVNQFESDVSIFAHALDDFLLFQEGEKKRRILVEQRTRDSEEGKAKSEAAKRFVQSELNGLLLGHTVSDNVLRMLRDGWSSYMVLLNLKHGDEHENLQQAKQIAADVIKAAAQGADYEPLGPEEIEALGGQLRAGLEQTAFMPFELDKEVEKLQGELAKIAQQRLVYDIELEHFDADIEAGDTGETYEHGVSALLEGPLEADLDNAADSPQPMLEDASAERLEADVTTPSSDAVPMLAVPVTLDEALADEGGISDSAIVAETATPDVEQEPAPEPPAQQVILLDGLQEEEIATAGDDILARIDRLSIGSWVEMREGEDKFYRCKLAAIIKTTGKYIFVNRMGVKVAEKSRAGLANAVQDNSVQLLDDGLLFDRALESVISTLRAK